MKPYVVERTSSNTWKVFRRSDGAWLGTVRKVAAMVRGVPSYSWLVEEDVYPGEVCINCCPEHPADADSA